MQRWEFVSCWDMQAEYSRKRVLEPSGRCKGGVLPQSGQLPLLVKQLAGSTALHVKCTTTCTLPSGRAGWLAGRAQMLVLLRDPSYE